MRQALKPAQVELFPGGAAQLPSLWAHRLHTPAYLLLLLAALVDGVALALGLSRTESELFFWLAAAATSLVTLARRLPGQNVLVSGLLIGGISFGIAALAARTKVPLSPRHSTQALEPQVLGVPGWVPLMWIAVIVSGRGVAQLVLRPWRDTARYGFHLIGLTCLLAGFLGAGLEPGGSWLHFPARVVVTLGILGFATPWLINKQPIPPPADFRPLATWLVFVALLLTGQIVHGLWLAAALCLALNLVAAVYAVRGGQRRGGAMVT